MLPGLVSITFRQLTPQQIVELCHKNQLQVIEWGGAVHVPHGDINTAMQVGLLTHEYGLDVAAYGSYYRLAASPADGLHFSAVLASAVALQTKAIRVWAGNRGSKDADPRWRKEVIQDALHCADLASEKGITICYEFHGSTLTDTLESTCDLLAATEHPIHQNPLAASSWSPTGGMSEWSAHSGEENSSCARIPLVAGSLAPPAIARRQGSLDSLRL